MDHFFPEWNTWCSFAAAYRQPAFTLDALENSHPIEVHVNTTGEPKRSALLMASHVLAHVPDEIQEIFDEISYNKGGSVISMIVDSL
jgi:aminopeptidase N